MPALVLVPSPLQASRASRRLCDAQGGVLFGAQVTTLPALAAGLLAGVGEARPVLTPLAEVLLAHAAGQEAGGPFAALPPSGGLAGALAAALAELRRGEVTARAARQAAAALPGAPGSRLGALAAALDALEGRLEAGGLLDGTAAVRAAAEAVRRGAPLGEAVTLDLLVVDGFAGFGPAEWALVAALAARSRRTRFHVPAFPDRPDLSAAADPYLRRVEGLHALAARAEVEVALTHLAEARAIWPDALLAAFGGGQAQPPDAAPGGAAGAVLGLVGEGEEGEAALAARAAARLVEGGVAPADVLAFHPAPGAAAARLAAAFAAEGLPFAAGRGRPLAEAPPVRAALDALGAAAGGLDRRSVERLAASTYLAARAPGRLPRLLDRAGALDGRAGPEAALRRRAASLEGAASRRAARERAALRAAADGLGALAALVRPLGGAATPDGHSRRLAGWLDASGLRRRAAHGDGPAAARDLAALARLEEAADGLARALHLAGRGAERLDAAAWRELLTLAVERSSVPPAGEPAAGAVELWGLDEAPGRTGRAALLLGCARGAFPAAPAPEPLLREPERQALNAALGRVAVATAGARRAEALHRAACAVAAGREVVALAWPGDGPSGGGAPAPLAAEALHALGLVPEGREAVAGLAGARTPHEALAEVARHARAGAGEAERAVACLPTALAGRARSALRRGEIEVERREAVLAGRATPHAGRLEGAALEAWAARLPAEWSASLLEAHARCPFRFLAAVGFGLDDPEATGLDIDGRDEGSLLHAVLERWVSARLARGAWPPDGGPADLAEARAVAEERFLRFEAEGRTGDPAVWAARRAAVLSRLDRIVAAEAASAGALRPALLEYAFGEGSPRPPLRLEAGGAAVAVKGRIDRVDASPDRLLVIDYKNARHATRHRPLLEPESFGVESFQVPLYLLAAARELPGRAPAATFQLLKSAERLEPVEGAPDEAALAAAVVETVGRVRAGDLPIRSRDCEGCPLGAVCRFQGVAEVGEGAEAGP